MQGELDNGASVAALRRFNDNLRDLPAATWGAPPPIHPAAAAVRKHVHAVSIWREAPPTPAEQLLLRPYLPLPASCPAASRLRPVMHELAYNLESFNPAFTAVLLRVQQTIGHSDYVRRDAALKGLIQPLAGEYGMHNNEPQGEEAGGGGRGRGGSQWRTRGVRCVHA